jgi:hypothetical protein
LNQSLILLIGLDSLLKMPATAKPPGPNPSLLELLPAQFPETRIPSNTDLEAAAASVLQGFPHFAPGHFTEDAIWRDSFALTGTLRTVYSSASVIQVLTTLIPKRGASAAALIPGSTKVVELGDDVAWVDCRFSFTTSNPATECSGFLSLVPSQQGGWKVWVMRTILEQIPGHGDVDHLQPTDRTGSSVEINNGGGAVAIGHHSDATSNSDVVHFQAVVIGGGQSGLSTGGRLQALGVPYVVLEKNARVGDAWRNRYRSARRMCKPTPTVISATGANALLWTVHTVREYCELPLFS